MQNKFKTGSLLASGYTIVQIRERSDGRLVVLAESCNHFATWFAEVNEERGTISLLEGNYFGAPSMTFDAANYADCLRLSVKDYLERLSC